MRKRLLIGAGVALDPAVLSEELLLLKKRGIKTDLLIDGRCTLVSPLEKELDVFLERLRGPSALGTTKRGIGPSYAMRAFRLAPRAADLFTKYDGKAQSKFYAKLGVRSARQNSWTEESRRSLEGLLGDVGEAVDSVNEKGGAVLFEGSQGTLLDILHGSYPYVTSTHTLATYLPASLGVSASSIGTVLGVMKCYNTRVGAGPFPTEVEGALGARIREIGKEYGATTGRPRRVGWLDLVALEYAVRLNGVDELAVSKVDVLSEIKDFKVCVAYRHDGSETTSFQASLGHLDEVEPVYETPLSLYGASFDGGIPRQVKKLIGYLEDRLKVRVRLVSCGEERSKTFEL